MMLLGVGAVGCGDADNKTALIPEGDPEVMQVFVKDSATEEANSWALIYGDHVDWTVRGTDELPLPSESAFATSQLIRVVVDELLQPDTLEMFRCACGDACTSDETSFAIEASSCTEDDPETAENDVGKFLDSNRDGVPDDAAMIPGLVTVTCGSAVWTNGLQDGFYNPSGNQMVPMDRYLEPNWDGVGPAIVVTPGTLPTATACTIGVATSIVDKDSNPIPMPTVGFTTETLMLLTSGSSQPSPAPDATNVAADTTIDLTFNAPIMIDDTDPTTTYIDVEDAAGVAVAGALVADDRSLSFTPAAALAYETVYTVTVKTAVTDTFGMPLGEEFTFSFTTASAPPPAP